MRVSEAITDYKQWTEGDIITITAGTGVGKSYFIKNNLYTHAKKNNRKILMLVHRLNCRDQFLHEVEKEGKSDILTIGTYQAIEQNALRGVVSNNVNPADYDYVVCDEFHYFMSDASFNQTTDLSLSAILDASNSVRIFMSATGDYVERYLQNYRKKEIVSYRLPISFDFIESLTFYSQQKTIEHYIELAIKKNEKAIFFMDSAKRAYDLHRRYREHSMFNCSASNKLFRHVNKEKLDSMLVNERFEDLILFTTTALDTGVNIHDKELNNIVCDVRDIRTMTQCIGRKRLQDKDDYIHLVVKSRHNQQLGGDIKNLTKEMEMVDFFKEHGLKELVTKFSRQYDKTNIIYDVWEDDSLTKRINELAYFKRMTDKYDITEMLKLGDYGYCKYVARWLGKYEEESEQYDYVVQEDQDMIDSLEEYLNSIVGEVMLQVKDRKELVKKMNVRDGNNRILKNIKTLNGMLKENNYDFIIDEFRTSKQVDGKRRYYRSAWRVRRLSDI